MNKAITASAVALFGLMVSAGLVLAGDGSNSGSGSHEEDDVRVEVRADEDDNRFRLEVREDNINGLMDLDDDFDDVDEDLDEDVDVEVEGTITDLSDTSVTVEGFTFAIDAATETEGVFGVGDFVEVEGMHDLSGMLVAHEIEAEDD